MLRFIIGRVGCGKTTYLHKLISQKVKEEKEQVILIVPKQFTFDTDSGILDTLGAKDACNVDVLSFSRLADTVLKTCRGLKKPPLTDGANAIIMSMALESVKDKLKFFSRHYNNISFIKKMLDEIKKFKQCAVTPKELSLAAAKMPDCILKNKLNETAFIYETYDAFLSNSFYDDNDLLTLVYDILLESTFFEGKIVAIDDFSRFSVQEMKIISVILKQAKEVYVTACCDKITETALSSPFYQSVNTVNRLRLEAAKQNVKVATAIVLTDKENGFSTYRSKELDFLQENIYQPSYEAYKESCQSIKLCAAKSPNDECDFVARQIKKFLREEKYRCRDIAVVYRDAQPYEKEIRYSLKKYGVPIFEDRRQPIENEPLVVFIRTLLEISANSFSTDRILRLLKTGLFSIDFDEIAKIENYVLMWSIDSSSWFKEWTDNPNGFGKEMNDEAEQYLLSVNETRKRIVDTVSFFCEKMKNANGKDSMTYLYRFLVENSVNDNLKEYAISLEESGEIELALAQEQVWDLMMEALDKIAAVIGENTVSAKRLCEVFELVVSSMSLGQLPNGFDEVYICGCERIATIMPKVIFVLGANAGVFPKTSFSDAIFTDFEKSQMKEEFPDLFDSVKNDVCAERFMVYNALCSAREKLFVLWSQSSLSGEKLSESEIVIMLRNLFSKIETVNTAFENQMEKVEGELPAFELMAKTWNDNTALSMALKKYFLSKEEYKGKIEAIERAAQMKPFSIENPKTAKELFGKNIYLSASKLDDYSLCPFKYFCKHELKAKPRTIAKLDPAQSGTLVHYVLEKLLKKHEGKSFVDVPMTELEKEMADILKDYIEKYMGGTKDKSDRFMYLYKRTFKILKVIVKRLLFEFSQSDFEPCDFELKIDKSVDGKAVKPFKVELEDGYIELYGIIDRVDKMEIADKKYIRVVDYKTGSKTFALSDVLGGLNMQMLLYLSSIWRNGKEYYGENIIPAGVLYLPARLEPYEIDRSDSNESVLEKQIKSGTMNGMILDEQEVLEGMDKKLSGTLIPITQKANGSISGNFISLSQLGKLTKKMDEIMAQMGNELHKGHIPAKPAYGKNHTDTCRYCDYKSVCLRYEDSPKRYVQSLKHGECLSILSQAEEVEEDGEKLDE